MKINVLLPLLLGKTFITDDCKNDNDCISGCCGFLTGKCAGPIIAVQRDGGCGHGDRVPNAKIARAMGFTGPFSGDNIKPKKTCECD